jgi:hypothetical protein
MTFDELLQLVKSEPPVTYEMDVSVPSAELLEELHRRRGMPLTEFTKDPRRTRERRTFREGHVLGTAASADELDDWQRRWPAHPLPADLRALLLRANGIHLWADLDTGRAYAGLAPLGEWDLARRFLWGPESTSEMLHDRYLGISYHSDNSARVALDVERRRYFLLDACGADDKSPIGDSADDLLAYLWRTRIAPRGAPSTEVTT